VATDEPIVAYFAPGGGLGHLNRALAVCLGLRDAGVDARIVTNSPFSAGLAGIVKCPMVRVQGDWADGARAYVEETRPRAVVTDTFPYGLREEWRGAAPACLIHVARRLAAPVFLTRADFSLIVEAEPLAAGHRLALGDSVVLDGPILLAPGRVRTPVPASLDLDGLTLVVHSGPVAEVEQLRALAAGPHVVISPWVGCEYYPATNLYARAGRVITGAGYNSMADMLAHKGRHKAVAFARRYDDQEARLRSFFRKPGDGTGQAVRAICSVL
jgi:predicted glycosyltransferase